jgi:hypothetical protein
MEELDVPTFAHMLDIFAFHCESIAKSKPRRDDAPYCNRDRFGLGLGGFGHGCPFINIEVVITPSERDPEPWGTWATVYTRPAREYANADERNAEPNLFDGTWQCHGNRCGGRQAYSKIAAPVLEWVARYHLCPFCAGDRGALHSEGCGKRAAILAGQ